MGKLEGEIVDREKVSTDLPEFGIEWSGWAYNSGGTVVANFESGLCWLSETSGQKTVRYLLHANTETIQLFQKRIRRSKTLYCTQDQTCPGYDELLIANGSQVVRYSVHSGWFEKGGLLKAIRFIRSEIMEKGTETRTIPSQKGH